MQEIGRLSLYFQTAEARVTDLTRALDERVAESNRAVAELRAEMSSHLAAGILFYSLLVTVIYFFLLLFAERERTLLTSQDILRKGEDDRKSLVTKYESNTSNLTQTIHRYLPIHIQKKKTNYMKIGIGQ